MLSSPEQRHTSINTKLEWVPDVSIFLSFFFFLTVLGLHCWAQAFSGCCEEGLLFLATRGLLSAVASLGVEHRL